MRAHAAFRWGKSTVAKILLRRAEMKTENSPPALVARRSRKRATYGEKNGRSRGQVLLGAWPTSDPHDERVGTRTVLPNGKRHGNIPAAISGRRAARGLCTVCGGHTSTYPKPAVDQPGEGLAAASLAAGVRPGRRSAPLGAAFRAALICSARQICRRSAWLCGKPPQNPRAKSQTTRRRPLPGRLSCAALYRAPRASPNPKSLGS
jgi:hypothetical protein